jgi:hypothetical protein
MFLSTMLTEQEHPKSPLICGQEITTGPSSPYNFEDVRTWIQNCTKAHPKCPKAEDTILPTRLIDVGSHEGRDPSLVITDNKALGKYLALSYCWGSSKPFVTTADNINSHLAQIPLASLPKTMQDAITITRNIGMQYLWIDALCILQKRYLGDELAILDWEKEGTRMSAIYGNAWLTIGAAAASDKTEGCFTSRPPDPTYFEIAYYEPENAKLIPDDEKIRTYARIEEFHPQQPSQIQGPTENRAWCFQEKFLSPRMLVYAPQQMHFVCQTSKIYESGRWLDIDESLNTLNRNPNSKTAKLATLRLWQSAVMDFSDREISFESDRLVAISGVAQQLAPYIGGAYYAGMWERNFIAEMTWRSKHHYHPRLSKRPWRPAETNHKAPSWSWLAVNGPVNYQSYINNPLPAHYYSRVIKAIVQLSPPLREPFGGVEGGRVELIGPVQRLRVVGRDCCQDDVSRSSLKTVKYLFELDKADTALGSDLCGRIWFDGVEPLPQEIWCLLLMWQDIGKNGQSAKMYKGIALSSVDENENLFKRVGYVDVVQRGIECLENSDTKHVIVE